MNVIIGNYGNETIALLQWAYEEKLEHVFVLSVNTGWAAKAWSARVHEGEALAKRYGFKPIHLSSHCTFSELVKERGEFPSTKFQWCSGFLKGLAINQYLDELDPLCQATLLKGDWPRNLPVLEIIKSSEYFNERKVWHPFYQSQFDQIEKRIQKTGLLVLQHRSLECNPCVNSSPADFQRLSQSDIRKTEQLENDTQQTMFLTPIKHIVAHAQNEAPNFDMGCGSYFGCGL